MTHKLYIRSRLLRLRMNTGIAILDFFKRKMFSIGSIRSFFPFLFSSSLDSTWSHPVLITRGGGESTVEREPSARGIKINADAIHWLCREVGAARVQPGKVKVKSEVTNNQITPPDTRSWVILCLPLFSFINCQPKFPFPLPYDLTLPRTVSRSWPRCLSEIALLEVIVDGRENCCKGERRVTCCFFGGVLPYRNSLSMDHIHEASTLFCKSRIRGL